MTKQEIAVAVLLGRETLMHLADAIDVFKSGATPEQQAGIVTLFKDIDSLRETLTAAIDCLVVMVKQDLTDPKKALN